MMRLSKRVKKSVTRLLLSSLSISDTIRISESRSLFSTPLQTAQQPRLSLTIRRLTYSTRTAARFPYRLTPSRTEKRSLFSLPRIFLLSATRYIISCLPQKLPLMKKPTASRSKTTASGSYSMTTLLLFLSLIRKTTVRLFQRAARATTSDSLRICPAAMTHGISLQPMLTVNLSLKTA